MLRIVFMGTPDFSVPALRVLHANSALNSSVVGVYTQPDRPGGRGRKPLASAVKGVALELSLPFRQPEKLSQPGELEVLTDLRPDVIVVAAYGQILKKNVLELPRLGCVNIHSSLLPRWRGAAPIQWAILQGDSETGLTTMKMAEGLDTGALYLQKTTPLSAEDTAKSVHDRLAVMGAELIVATLEGLVSGTLHSRAQDDRLATYAKKLTKEMEALDPREGAELLGRKVRALNPWPGAALTLSSGERLRVRMARVRRDVLGPPGTIYEKGGMILVGTPDGSLELLQVQWEGRGEVDMAGFLNGLRGRGKDLPLTLESRDG